MPARWLVCLVTLAITSEASSFRDPIYRETEVRQSRPRIAGEKFDPQERNPKLRAAFAAADAAAERRVANVKRDERFALKFWAAKKQILGEKFSIDWKSPADLNPTIVYESYGQPRVTAAEIRAITPIVRRHFRDPAEKITSFDRTFEGTVEVWTTLQGAEGAHQYELRGHDRHWTFFDSHLVLP
jgi:hypothetical protein